MWTYRPADSSTPIQQKSGPRAATARTESVDRFSAAASHERRSTVQQPAAFIRAQQQRVDLSESLLREETARAKDFGSGMTARPGHAQVRPARMIRTACVLGSLYLAGLVAGSLSSRFLSGRITQPCLLLGAGKVTPEGLDLSSSICNYAYSSA